MLISGPATTKLLLQTLGFVPAALPPRPPGHPPFLYMKKSLFLLALLTGLQHPSQAQTTQPAASAPTHQATGETPAHPSPHGGVVHTAGSYHLEAVQQGQRLAVYLFDGKMQPLSNQQVTGSALVDRGGQPTSLTLAPAGGDRLQAALPKGAAPVAVTVQLKRDGQSVSARFESLNVATGTQEAPAAYACPMHPSETSATPGSCPKCHMALRKRS